MTISIPTSANDITTASNGAAPSLVINKPTATADGDWLFAVFYNRNSSGTITAPAGWTQIFVNTTNWTHGLFLKYIPSAAAETATSYTFSSSSGTARTAGVILRIVGADTSQALDVAGILSAYTGTSSIVVPEITTTDANDALLLVTVTHSASATPSAAQTPAGWSALAQVDAITSVASSVSVFTKTLSSAGPTGNVTVPLSPAASNSAGSLVGLIPVFIPVTFTNALKIILR